MALEGICPSQGSLASTTCTPAHPLLCAQLLMTWRHTCTPATTGHRRSYPGALALGRRPASCPAGPHSSHRPPGPSQGCSPRPSQSAEQLPQQVAQAWAATRPQPDPAQGASRRSPSEAASMLQWHSCMQAGRTFTRDRPCRSGRSEQPQEGLGSLPLQCPNIIPAHRHG